MKRECDQCGVTAADLPDLGLEEEEADEFFQIIEGVTLCAGCAQYPAILIGEHECEADYFGERGAYCECGEPVDIWEDGRYN